MYFGKSRLFFLLSILFLNTIVMVSSQNEVTTKEPIINKIFIEGNKHVKPEVILNRIPYKENNRFDKKLSSMAINNLYGLGYFRQIQIETEQIDENKINLYITVEEKKLLEKIEFKGNKTIKTKQFFEKLKLDKLTTVDEEHLQRISKTIVNMYKEENKHSIKISYKIIPNKENPDKATALFEINEGPSGKIARVHFVGNKQIPSRKLRKNIFTRENWLLSFMDGAGQYNDEAVDMDKHRIEYFYRDLGFLMVKVSDVKIEFSKNQREINVTFYIKEGEKFTVRNIEAQGGDGIFIEKELLEKVELESGEPYSQSLLIKSINQLKSLWGEKGYIYADVYPQIKPDEKNNTVDVIFNCEKGNKMYTNRIIISGNKVTLDKVIRRQLTIYEGDLITSKKLNESQNNVEYLSFFERGGVNWRIHKISDDLADLELHVKESKTGNLSAGLSYGTDRHTTKRSVKGNLSVEKKNLLGRGWDVGGLIQASRHRLNKMQASFFEPSLFDRDLSAAINIYRQEEEYDQWTILDKKPVEKVAGVDMQLGFLLPQIDKRLRFILELGIEDISYNKRRGDKFIVQRPQEEAEVLQPIVNRKFKPGTLTWIGADLVSDKRNHQIYPNRGYRLALNTKTALPPFNNAFSFFKAELEGSWYTPLIGEDSLVLALHGKAGGVHSLSDEKIVPYKELFHMGGQTTVRGFVWGSIGPAWRTGDPLGARYATQFNAELLFPLVPDYSMKGHVFYDAGAGWNTPKYDIPNRSYIKRDKFDLRHSVGFGLNLVHPVPAKIDWGYKLDRRKKDGESAHEFHLSMNYAW